MDLDEAIKNRKSIRKFKTQKPDWRDILECIDLCRYTPMAGDNFSLKFILIDKKETIKKISEAAQQDFIKQAHYIVVVCSIPERTKNAYGERAEIYLRQQAGAAIQNFLLKIQEKKLSACWVGHLAEDQIKRELMVPNSATVEAIIPIGYANEKPRNKRQIDMDSILYFHKYGTKKMESPKKPEA